MIQSYNISSEARTNVLLNFAKSQQMKAKAIEDDLIDPDHPVVRKVTVNTVVDDKSEHDLKVVKSIPYKLWLKFADWGAESGELNLNLQSKAREIANELKYNRKISSASVVRGMAIFDKVCEENYELLEEIDSLREEELEEKEQKEKERNTVKSINVNDVDIDIELIKRMVEWGRHHRILGSWKFKVMQDVALGLKPLNEKLKWGFRFNLKSLLLHGFDEL